MPESNVDHSLSAVTGTLLVALALGGSAWAGGGGGETAVTCDDGTRLSVDHAADGHTVTVIFEGEEIVLRRARAASGARYASNGHEYWEKGETSLWTFPGRAVTLCRPADGGKNP